jgi:hypothetical protein
MNTYRPLTAPLGPALWRIALALTLLLSTFAVFADATEAQTRALAEALRLSAPQTDREGLYGDWKVKAEIIPAWSERCLGSALTPEQFAADQAAARQVVQCIMGRELNRQLALVDDEGTAVRRAAAWWMTGDPEQYDQGGTAAYTDRVLSDYWGLLEIQTEAEGLSPH